MKQATYYHDGGLHFDDGPHRTAGSVKPAIIISGLFLLVLAAALYFTRAHYETKLETQAQLAVRGYYTPQMIRAILGEFDRATREQVQVAGARFLNREYVSRSDLMKIYHSIATYRNPGPTVRSRTEERFYTYVNLGDRAKQAGRYHQALVYYRHAVSLRPDSKYVRESIILMQRILAAARPAEPQPLRSFDRVKQTVDNKVDYVLFLYNRALDVSPGLRGEVAVRAEIRSDGQVAAIRVLENSLPDDAFANILADRVRLWRFRPVADGTEAYPVQVRFELKGRDNLWLRTERVAEAAPAIRDEYSDPMRSRK